ncbi:hypothetical protein LUZ60_001917 [Juncus effusus]|nr:hypothetical protein LUZ60_001917 [Juncus effusus]
MNERGDDGTVRDSHENDLVMPGFRFHPTEEELIEFYLRRKIEGKRFNVELITFLDLYRYDPWELPAMAAIGEKEWFFYVPRDRKYRNGDRPNRVTTSGYWKATGADRMIRAENNRPIGLKKTLVFYSGKAPKGVRSSWIMNEYRLPQSDTDRYQKAEISLCRVYKRTGVEDHSPQSDPSPTKPSSSQSGPVSVKKQMPISPQPQLQPLQGDNYSSTPINGEKSHKYHPNNSLNNHTILNTTPNGQILSTTSIYGSAASVALLSSTTSTEEDGASIYRTKNSVSLGSTYCPINMSSSPSLISPPPSIDELSTLVGHNHQSYSNNIVSQQNNQLFSIQSQQTNLVPAHSVPMNLANISDKLWEWNPLPDASRDYSGFK